MSHETQTLRTVADFARVPPSQLPQCLRAFKGWLHQQQPADAAHREFVWAPDAAKRESAAPEFSTELRDFGLHPGAVRQLGLMGIVRLEEVVRLSETELGRIVHVGPRTVARVTELLAAIGLALREGPPRGTRIRSQVLPQLAREDVDDDTSVERLGLKAQTVRKLAALCVRTVGELRDLKPADLASALSLQRRHEVFRTLRVLGLPLRSNPGELELWHAGLLRVCDLREPRDEAGVCELQPWLGALAKTVESAGVRTVGQLRLLARAGIVHRTAWRIPPSSWARIRRHFGMSPQDTLRPEPLRDDQAHADGKQRETRDVAQLQPLHEMAAVDVHGL
jgi:hypothetical protein